MSKGVIIVGSARQDGDTAQLVSLLSKASNWAMVDLNDYQIEHFDYSHTNRN
ncbi:MAG: FMN reductase, partial [Phaeodactylibacter sp.]|nr:FMN reductase [Phaeodactylibacter sp.]